MHLGHMCMLMRSLSGMNSQPLVSGHGLCRTDNQEGPPGVCPSALDSAQNCTAEWTYDQDSMFHVIHCAADI